MAVPITWVQGGGLGFGSGSSQPRVFADFESRVFVGFQICAKKWQIFEKIHFFLLSRMYDNFF